MSPRWARVMPTLRAPLMAVITPWILQVLEHDQKNTARPASVSITFLHQDLGRDAGKRAGTFRHLDPAADKVRLGIANEYADDSADIHFARAQGGCDLHPALQRWSDPARRCE